MNPHAGRALLAASILGSGAVFVEGTVVNIALPAIARDFGLGLDGLQWVVTGYLITLSALMLLGGALGDRFGSRRVFIVGALSFSAVSACCAIAPSAAVLLGTRMLEGAAGALLVPNSLAMLETAFSPGERGAAIGHWAGWTGISAAAGPFMGGWLVDVASWRWVFVCVIPLAIVGAWLAARQPELGVAGPTQSVASGPPAGTHGIDYLGAILVTAGLSCASGALISGPRLGFTNAITISAAVIGLVCFVVFIVVERRVRNPLLPLDLFRSRQFSGANITTLFIYSALSGLLLLLVLQLHNNLGYTALETGAALLPTNVMLVALAPLAGRVAHRVGARVPMLAGAVLASIGMLVFARVQPGVGYVTVVLPAVIVFGIGLAALVAPLTSVVLGSVADDRVGVASGVNNAAARLAGLIAVAALPLAAGLGGLDHLAGPSLTAGFVRAMWINAGLCAAGAVTILMTIDAD